VRAAYARGAGRSQSIADEIEKTGRQPHDQPGRMTRDAARYGDQMKTIAFTRRAAHSPPGTRLFADTHYVSFWMCYFDVEFLRPDR
jgi:hypothetical protein